MTIFIHGSDAAGSAPEEEVDRSGSRERLRRAARRVGRDLHDALLLSRPSPTGQRRPREVTAAVREGCVLRVLRLKRFLYDEAEPGGAVVAEDFFTSPEVWRRARPERSALLEDWLEDLADAVAPVVEPGPPVPIPSAAWPLREFVAAVSEAFGAFLEHIPPDRREWFAGTSTD